jgi:hypothetical protein
MIKFKRILKNLIDAWIEARRMQAEHYIKHRGL